MNKHVTASDPLLESLISHDMCAAQTLPFPPFSFYRKRLKSLSPQALQPRWQQKLWRRKMLSPMKVQRLLCRSLAALCKHSLLAGLADGIEVILVDFIQMDHLATAVRPHEAATHVESPQAHTP